VAPFVISFSHSRLQRRGGFYCPGEEFLVALNGAILFTVGSREFVLGPGDALYFDSSIPHWGKTISCENGEAADIGFPVVQLGLSLA
jgi:hypothetical protein